LHINFGGGLPIPYKAGEAEFDLNTLKELAEPLLREELEYRDGKLSFLFEPGRYVMAQAGVLLTTVTSVKDQGPRTYLGCDTGFNHLVRPVLYDAWHEVVNLSRYGEGAVHVYTLAGNICESGDLLAENRELPVTYEGNVLALGDAGAYGMVMASEYNRRRLPAEVLVCNDGTTKLIRKRDTIQDVIERHLSNCNYPVQLTMREP
jgi:diaminopimelate decarboxylase